MERALDPERWQRLSRLLDGALDLPPEARAEYLREACGGDGALLVEAQELLAAEAEAGRFLEAPLAERSAPLVAEMIDGLGEEDAAPSGRLVGTYRLLGELGEGGMGTVYLAERADGQFEQKVAIKFLRHGLHGREARRRFLQERQILARLEHPAIARLLDGGVTDEGVPYFVMERVEGRPVTAYCAEGRLGIEARLGVFLGICDAAHYAHRNLVVHRDLKPSNVLVDAAGRVKLLDFGIAKLLADRDEGAPSEVTRTLLPAMTPEYAAPEQVRGDPVTTATDVYALGVLLFELLTGARPYRVSSGGRGELERAILDQEPLRPSALVPALRGDLDGIVGKALQKEPERRYPSADALADDLRRHLQGLPVAARGNSLAYRTRTFTRRHRLGVAVGALLLLFLAGGLVGTISQARRAQREATKAEAVKDFLKSLFAASDPAEAKGQERTARQLLHAGAERIGTELQDQPEVQSDVARLIADVYFQLGEYESALPLLRDDLERRRRLEGARSVAAAESMTQIANVLYDQGRFDEAAGLYEDALAIQREQRGERSAEVAELLWDLGGVRRNRDDLAGAERLDQQALDIFVETKGDQSKEAFAARESLAIVYARGERLAEAADLQEQVATWRERHYGPDHPHTLNARYNLATYLLARGRLLEAERIAEDVVARQRRVMGNRHDRLGASLRVLARTLDGQGKAEAALPLMAEALSIHRERFGPDHFQVAFDLTGLGTIEAHTPRLALGADHCLQAVALLGAQKAATPRDLATARLHAGLALVEAGRLEEALRQISPAVAQLAHETGTRVLYGRALDAQGTVALARGQTAEAVSLGRQAVSVLEPVLGSDGPIFAVARVHLGAALWADGQRAEGEGLLRAGVESLQREFPAGHPDLAGAHFLIGRTLAAAGRHAEAQPLLQGALEWRQTHFGATDPRTLATRRALAPNPPSP